MNVIAYHGSERLKATVLAQIEAHRRADEIQPGAYYLRRGGGTRVCAVGCVLRDPAGGHVRYESEFGIPEQLAHVEDYIFELLDDVEMLEWPRRFMDAVPVGADLDKVWPRFAAWLLNFAPRMDWTATDVIARAYERIARGEILSGDEIALASEASNTLLYGIWEARTSPGLVSDTLDAFSSRCAGRITGAGFASVCAEKLIELIEATA